MSKFCTHCGSELKGGASFCPNCGASVNDFKKEEVVTGTVVNNNGSTTTIVKDNTTLAFVCSIIGFLCCTYVAIPGLILSIQSLNDMKEGKIDSKNKWMAITGIVLSCLGLVQMVYNFINPNQEIMDKINDFFNK